jgi:hypothetical protein
MTKQEVRVPDIREPRAGEAYRHRARGTSYTIIGRANLQTDRPISDDESLVIYRGKDGALWARPVREFRDGRFEPAPNASRRADLAKSQVTRDDAE